MPIFSVLFLLLLTVPVIEIFLLIKVGSSIGAGYTILLVFGTAILGAYLLRKQGLSTLARAQQHLGNQQIPAMEMIEGLILLLTGALLLTPGFFTDAFGFLCLIPAVRQILAKKLIKQFTVIQAGNTFTQPHSTNSETKSGTHTIEGQFWKDEDK